MSESTTCAMPGPSLLFMESMAMHPVFRDANSFRSFSSMRRMLRCLTVRPTDRLIPRSVTNTRDSSFASKSTCSSCHRPLTRPTVFSKERKTPTGYKHLAAFIGDGAERTRVSEYAEERAG